MIKTLFGAAIVVATLSTGASAASMKPMMKHDTHKTMMMHCKKNMHMMHGKCVAMKMDHMMMKPMHKMMKKH